MTTAAAAIMDPMSPSFQGDSSQIDSPPFRSAPRREALFLEAIVLCHRRGPLASDDLPHFVLTGCPRRPGPSRSPRARLPLRGEPSHCASHSSMYVAAPPPPGSFGSIALTAVLAM